MKVGWEEEGNDVLLKFGMWFFFLSLFVFDGMRMSYQQSAAVSLFKVTFAAKSFIDQAEAFQRHKNIPL